MQHQPHPATSWPTTKWGQVRWGSRRISALSIAIPSGLILAVLFAAVTVWSGLVAEQPVIGALVFGLAVFFPAVALNYVLIVDRRTIQGATARPEESVETQWYDKASSGALTDMVMIAGILLIILVFLDPIVLDARVLLTGVIVFAMLGTGVRYLVLRQRGRADQRYSRPLEPLE